MEQRIARIHRLGQKDPIEAYNLMSRNGTFLEGVRRIVDENEPSPGAGGEEPGESEEDCATATEIDDLVDAADETLDDTDAFTPTESIAIPVHEEIQHLVSQLKIQPREDGGMHIEASPSAAASLANLFEGLADLLRAAEKPK